jgi:hypothetical protein
MHALELTITPDRCTTDILYVVLEPNPRSKIQPNLQMEIAHSFRVQSTAIHSFADTREIVKETGLLPDSLFQNSLESSRQLRNQGGLGQALVMIHVPVARIMHATPFGFVDNAEIIPLNTEWERQFMRAIEMGLIL